MDASIAAKIASSTTSNLANLESACRLTITISSLKFKYRYRSYKLCRSDPTLAYPRNSALALDYTSPAIWVVAGIDKHKYDAAVVVAVDSSNATNNGYDG